MTLSTYATVMHLSQYAAYLVPMAGVIVPIGMWLYARDQNEFVNEHGQDLINFIISCFVYGIVFGILCFIGIGYCSVSNSIFNRPNLSNFRSDRRQQKPKLSLPTHY